MNLLLVDTAVMGYRQIVAAANVGTQVVTFDSRLDTYESLKTAIATAGVSRFVAVGIVQHGSHMDVDYRLLRRSAPAIVDGAEEMDPSLTSWAEFAGFLKGLKAEYGVAIVDFISCQIYSNLSWVYVLNELERQTGLNLRASSDDTGNLANGGNWVQESDGVNIEGVYFTEAIRAFTGLLYFVNYYTSSGMVSAQNPVNNMVGVTGNFKRVDRFVGYPDSAYITAPTGITGAGALSTWGNFDYGGASSGETGSNIANPNNGGITGGVLTVARTFSAFAALKENGAVSTWGYIFTGGASSGEIGPTGNTNTTPNNGGITGGVIGIAATNNAFAALKTDGSVSTWGLRQWGGASSGESVSGTITIPNNGGITGGVIAIASTFRAFAALKSNGAVSTWGAFSVSGAGGGGASSGETGFPSMITTPNNGGITSSVVAIASSSRAFAAIKENGAVSTWGQASYGGASSGQPVSGAITTPLNGGITDGVVAIASTVAAFAALKADGSVSTWGTNNGGGASNGETGITGTITIPNNGGITGGVIAIAANNSAFAALKADGSVSTWGAESSGGASSGETGISNVITIPNNGGITGGVIAIAATNNAFAALKSDGSVSTWGSIFRGGASSGESGPLGVITTPKGGITGGVIAIASNNDCFAALKADGSVSTWGYADAGGASSGETGFIGGLDYNPFPNNGGITGDVRRIASTLYAFAALRTNGAVSTWGATEYGGSSSGEDITATITVPNNGGITGNIKALFSASSAFAALHRTPQAITFTQILTGTVGQPPILLTAFSSSGLPITYTSSNPAVATVSGNLLTIVGAGSAIITASQDGDFNFEPAVSVTQPLTATGGVRRRVGAMDSSELLRIQHGLALVNSIKNCVNKPSSTDLLEKQYAAGDIRFEGTVVKKSCC